jgi:hypothetical protein
MTPSEVNGLQSLAMAHGGSLTINPQTGLPEASFLEDILPIVAGFALNAFLPGVGSAIGGAFGASGAVGTGLLVGGATGLATGSLEKGLMAGLGAYGGAGLGTGIAETGAQLGSVPQASVANAPVTQIAGSSSPAYQQITGNALSTPTSSVYQGITGQPLANATSALTPSTTDLLGTGLKNSFGNGMEGLKALYGNLPTGTLPALGIYGMNAFKKDAPAPEHNPGLIRPYKLDRQQNQDAYKTYRSDNGQRMPVNAYGEPMDSSERTWFNDTYTAGNPYKAPGPEYAAEGGLMGLAVGGMPEQQAAFNAVGMNSNYPMSHLDTPMYSDPGMQRPMAREVVNPAGDVGVDEFTGEARMAGGGMTAFSLGGSAFADEGSANPASPTYDYTYNPQDMTYTETATTPPPTARIGGKGGIQQAIANASQGAVNPSYSGGFGGLIPTLLRQQQQQQPTTTTRTIGGMSDAYIPQTQIGQTTPKSDIAQYADGGIANLGGYSDGGRLLRGPGDGVSDSIPASIGDRQPARLADGEFVVPARIVSEIGNGSTEAGARKLYAMMDRVQHARKKSIGKGKVAVNSKAEKLLPA